MYLPCDPKSGCHKSYGFVEFEHIESVSYSIQLLNGIWLFGRPLKVRTAGKSDSSSVSNGVTGLQSVTSPSIAIPMEKSTTSKNQHPVIGESASINTPPVTLGQRSTLPHKLFTPNDAHHPTLGLRLDPPVNSAAFSLNEAHHPTLGLRLDPPVNSASRLTPNEAHHPTLGLRLDPPVNSASRLTPNEAHHPTLGLRLDPPVNNTAHLFPNEVHHPTRSLRLVSPMNIDTPPSMSSSLFPDKNHSLNHHYNSSSGSSNHPPPLLSPSLPCASKADFVEDTMEPESLFSGPPHHRLHENRVVHLEDKPSWVTEETKHHLRDYHLLQLGKTIAAYKDLFSNKNGYRVSNHI